MSIIQRRKAWKTGDPWVLVGMAELWYEVTCDLCGEEVRLWELLSEALRVLDLAGWALAMRRGSVLVGPDVPLLDCLCRSCRNVIYDVEYRPTSWELYPGLSVRLHHPLPFEDDTRWSLRTARSTRAD